MNSEYRQLTESEILTLEDQGCYAQDWNNVKVAEDFLPHYVKNVSFYGYNNLGVFEKDLEVTKGFLSILEYLMPHWKIPQLATTRW